MEANGILLYMAADNDLNPYGRLNDLKEIMQAQTGKAVPIAIQFHSPKEDEGKSEGILSMAFKEGKEIDCIRTKKGINTGDPKYLLDFIQWGVHTLQCQNYSLIIWGHGLGPIDIESQADLVMKSVAFDFSDTDSLTTAELFEALDTSLKGKKFSLLGFDACYMGSLEVMYELSQFSDAFVASEAPVPEMGWPYDLILDDIASKNPGDGFLIGEIVCNRFLDRFHKEKAACISLLDTGKSSTLVQSIETLVNQLLTNLSDPRTFQAIFRAKSRATTFGKNFIDLYGFIKNLIESYPIDSPISLTGKEIMNQISQSVLLTKSQGIEGANGVSILFPPLPLGKKVTDRYSKLAFCQQTRWHELLTIFQRGGM